MNLEYIDIHSHLNSPQFKNDIDEVIQRMKENKVGTIVIGVDKETSIKAVELADKYENVWACVGLHPTDSKEDFDEKFFEDLVSNPKVVAIGECGLDYFHQKDEKRQKELFKKQIDFAVKHDLPLMLHVRDAHEDVLEILKEKKKEHGDKLRGNSHFFSSTWEIAQKYFEIGFNVSFTGIITFTKDFDEIIQKAPIDMIHIETDSPYASPHRGKRNEPSYVIEVLKKIEEVKGEKVREKLLENTTKFFNLSA